jgi:tetratricopeptide (TPR) repeat protein
VVDRIGRGGMGVVYSAYDPELDRRVALKLLQGNAAGEAGTRFLREAQAMARLSHPCVITVHDVGTLGGRVFIAMELVEGGTNLRGWLGDAKRSWREVVKAFISAGRGLAAAHAAGLIHRDFKPDNVLVSKDGRMRVTDFGLARLASDAGPSKASLWDETEISGPFALPLTAAGLVMGTPGYMPPEQCMGGTVDARTDQFSFCVALYEGLHGDRPFGHSGSLRDFLGAVRDRRTQPPPPDAKVPAWLRRVVLKGLSYDPSDRYPSMEALLRELEHDPDAAFRRRATWAGGALAMLAVAGGVTFAARQDRGLCKGAERRLAGIWDDRARAYARKAFGASKLPYAKESLAGASRALDAYASGWAQMAHESCEAAKIRGEQSDELYSRRTVCLERRLQELSAFTALLGKADDQVVETAVAAAQRLEPLARCADSGALLAAAAPPGEDIRPRVEATRAKIAQARAMLEAGQFQAGLPVAKEAVEAARAVGYKPAEGEAFLQLGTMEYRLGDAKAAEGSLHGAVVAADAAHDDATRGLALARLGDAVGYEQGRIPEGSARLEESRAVLERLGPGAERDLLEARLRTNLARLREREERFPEEQAEFERALALIKATMGEENLETARAESNLGVALLHQRKGEPALAHLRQALAITERAHGPGHPIQGHYLNNVAEAQAALGEHEQAIAARHQARQLFERVFGAGHQFVAATLLGEARSEVALGHGDRALEALNRALEIHKARLGPEHPRVADTIYEMARTHVEVGRLGEAASSARRAVELYRRSLGEAHNSVADGLDILGEALVKQGRLGEARVAAERSLAIRLQAFGAEAPVVAICHNNLGDLARAEGRPREAETSYRRALELSEKPTGDENSAAYALAALGEIELGRGAPERGIPDLEKALALRDAHPSESPRLTAEICLSLARALRGAGQTERARAMAQRAADLFTMMSDKRAHEAAALVELPGPHAVH